MEGSTNVTGKNIVVLFIAILGLVVLLIIFFTLKPNSDTVESFEQQNGNEIPVQFQSLDQSQPVETTILDNNAVAPAKTEQAAMMLNQIHLQQWNM